MTNVYLKNNGHDKWHYIHSTILGLTQMPEVCRSFVGMDLAVGVGWGWGAPSTPTVIDPLEPALEAGSS